MTANGGIDLSQDTGTMHTRRFDTGAADAFDVDRLASSGSRVFAATGTQVLRSDPSWTAWSATKLGGADHDVPSRDAGSTWSVLPGPSGMNPRTLGVDASEPLLVGPTAHGLHRTPYPR